MVESEAREVELEGVSFFEGDRRFCLYGDGGALGRVFIISPPAAKSIDFASGTRGYRGGWGTGVLLGFGREGEPGAGGSRGVQFYRRIHETAVYLVWVPAAGTGAKKRSVAVAKSHATSRDSASMN